MSHSAMSTAESASPKMPPGPELPAAWRSLAVTASPRSGSSPTVRRASASTASRSAPASAPPKKVRPMPTRPWSVPSSRVTKSRVALPWSMPTTSGLSAGVRIRRVVTWLTFIGLLLASGRSAVGRSGAREGVVERLGDVGNQIVGVLDAHGVADEIVLDTDLEPLLGGELVEAHDRGLLYEALRPAERRRDVRDAAGVDRARGRVEVALHLEGDHAAEAPHLLLGDVVLRMRR